MFKVEGMCKTIEITEKRCSKCGEVKPVGEYAKDKRGKYGLVAQCKSCEVERLKKWRSENRQEFNKKARIYYKNNRKKIITNSTKWAKNNPDKVEKIREEGKEKHILNSIKWAKNNPDKVKKNRKNWYLKSKFNLTDTFIKNRLSDQFGFTFSEIEALETDVISAKRKQIEIHRKMKQIKTT